MGVNVLVIILPRDERLHIMSAVLNPLMAAALVSSCRLLTVS